MTPELPTPDLPTPVFAKPGGAHRRIDAIDALRGTALLGMFVFHATWDLQNFGFVSQRAVFNPGFMLFGHAVATTFLTLAGASLVLAIPDGEVRPKAWMRLGQIVAGAAAVSAATWWLMPDEFVFFGILHCIALGSLLGLGLLRLPPAVPLALGIAAIAAPWVVADPAFNQPWLSWVGLGTQLPRTVDGRPVFPWLGFILVGLGAMRIAVRRGWPATWAEWHLKGAVLRPLLWGGRHSLLVYLVHQPLFFGAVWLLAQVMTPSLPATAVQDPFVTSCISQCVGTGADVEVCATVCRCISTEVRQHPATWQRLVSNALSPADQSEIDGYTRQCVRAIKP
jgi:uncharacterized membrane protein